MSLAPRLLLLLSLTTACGAEAPGEGPDEDAGTVLVDAGRPDAGRTDAGRVDAGRPDAGPVDAGEPDAGEPDAGSAPVDAGPEDAGAPDAGPVDAGIAPIDAGVRDAGAPDAGPVDAGRPDAGRPDSGPVDAGVADAGGTDAGSADAGPELRPLLYPEGRTQSPLTPDAVARLQAIAARGPALHEDVFIKVGDSITVSGAFLQCLDGTAVDLGGRTHLDATRLHFAAGRIASTSPYDRVSSAASVGKSASWALAGSPSPLAQEMDAAEGRYAVLMYGTNDIGNGTGSVHSYGRNLLALVDTLTAAGVVPVVSSVPPRDDSTAADLQVPRFNLVARGVAQARGVPFVDLHRELLPLPSHGLGSDGIHPNSAPAGSCRFNATGLEYGYDVRNLITLEALDRMHGAIASGRASDVTGPRLDGAGSGASPFEVATLPFTDVRDTRTFGETRFGTYPGCSATQDEGGREVLYRLVLTRPTHVRAWVISATGADLDLHLLDATATPGGCVERNDTTIDRTLAAGTWTFVVDTYVSSGVARSGEFLFAMREEP